MSVAMPWPLLTPSSAARMTADQQHQLHEQHLVNLSRYHSNQHYQHHHHQREQQQARQRCCGGSGGGRLQQQQPHVKKPLNAFMIFMKEMRQSVIDECTLKESAAINQILGRRVSIMRRRRAPSPLFGRVLMVVYNIGNEATRSCSRRQQQLRLMARAR